MAKVGQIKSGTMRVGNTTSTGYGIVYSDEIIGHRRVAKYSDLANIPLWSLYDKAGGADIQTAVGQLWYVATADSSHPYGMYLLTAISSDGATRTWVQFKGSDTSYSLPTMTSSIRGGARLGSDTVQSIDANSVTATNNRTYAIQKNSNELLVVNVPWVNNNDNTTYTFTSGSSGSFTVTPSNGTAQTVSIGKPAEATKADTATSAGKATNDGNGKNIADTYATKDQVSALSSALVYRGTVNSTKSLPQTGVKVGDVYVVAEAGTYAGQVCESGDMIIALTVTTASGSTTQTITWTIVQTNINGAVTSSSNINANVLVVGNGNRTIKAVTNNSKAGFVKVNTNGVVEIDNNSYLLSVPAATTSTYGGFKIPEAASAHTFGTRDYKVKLDSTTGVGYVNVPWTDTDTKYSLPKATDSILGGVLVNDVYDITTSNISKNDAAISISLSAKTTGSAYTNIPYASADGNQAGLIKIGFTLKDKNYPVKLDSNNNAYVNVPWTDNNTIYKASAPLTLTSNTFGISAANATTNGYMSSDDAKASIGQFATTVSQAGKNLVTSITDSNNTIEVYGITATVGDDKMYNWSVSDGTTLISPIPTASITALF